MAYQDNEKRQVFEDRNIADDRQQEQVLKGLQPKNQLAFRIYKYLRIFAILGLFISGLFFGLSFIKIFNQILASPTIAPLISKIILYGLMFSVACIILMVLIRLTLLRKCPFDDWVFEVAQRDLGTDVIFYTNKCLYIKYDISSSKEVDKRDFVTKMSDLSQHYSYFFVKSFPDEQVIQVECTKRQPIPDRASFTPDDDLFWNIVPLGLTINNTTQNVSAIGWWLNDQNRNEELVPTVPSTSILICGGTGCHGKDELIIMENNLIKNIEDILLNTGK